MTKREAAIVAAYTGYLIGKFDEMHGYIEEIMEGPVFTHQLGSKSFADEVKARSKKDFVSIVVE